MNESYLPTKTNEHLKYCRQLVSKGYPAVHPFMVYFNFYNFLFPVRDIKKS